MQTLQNFLTILVRDGQVEKSLHQVHLRRHKMHSRCEIICCKPSLQVLIGFTLNRYFKIEAL